MGVMRALGFEEDDDQAMIAFGHCRWSGCKTRRRDVDVRPCYWLINLAL